MYLLEELRFKSLSLASVTVSRVVKWHARGGTQGKKGEIQSVWKDTDTLKKTTWVIYIHNLFADT